MHKIKLANILSLLVFLIVCTVPVAFLFNIPSLYYFGKPTIISPLPIPFRDNDGLENYVYQQEFYLYSGGKKLNTSDYEHIREYYRSGPHKRSIAFTQTVIMAPKLDPLWTNPVYEYTICKNDLFLIQIDKIEVNYFNKRTRQNDFTVTYECK